MSFWRRYEKWSMCEAWSISMHMKSHQNFHKKRRRHILGMSCKLMSTTWRRGWWWLCHKLLAVLSKKCLLLWSGRGENTFVMVFEGGQSRRSSSNPCDEANWLVETSVVAYPHEVIWRLIPCRRMDVTCRGMHVTGRVIGRRVTGGVTRWRQTRRKTRLSVWLEGTLVPLNK